MSYRSWFPVLQGRDIIALGVARPKEMIDYFNFVLAALRVEKASLSQPELQIPLHLSVAITNYDERGLMIY